MTYTVHLYEERSVDHLRYNPLFVRPDGKVVIESKGNKPFLKEIAKEAVVVVGRLEANGIKITEDTMLRLQAKNII